MPKGTRLPALSKLSRPRLFGAVARERLFERLDAARDLYPGICVVGPPGGGKTTLIASWLEVRRRGGIWYQVDAGDADPATFFHYLGQAALPHARRGQRPLPALTPEYLPDVHGFSRRFFRELFARLPPKSILVLDNYQEVDADNVLHGLVAAAVDEVPPGSHLIVVSRADPPACYARLKANRSVTTFDWDDLRLTLDEALAIGHLQHAADDATLRTFHERCDGWAAGLILMLAERGAVADTAVSAGAAPEAVFDYFAGTLFDRAPADLRHMLLSVAFLPYVRTGWAAEVSGDPGAGAMLEQLYRRHFFTQRRPEADGSYQFHALFQGFLKSRARRHFTEEQYDALLLGNARLLRAAGEVEAAFDLDCMRGHWEAAAALLEDEAERMIGAGRWQTFAQCVLRLPGRHVDDNPWLSYWLGVALTPVDQEEARRRLEAAYHRFRHAGHRIGQALSIAGILNAMALLLQDMARTNPWIERLTVLLDAGIEYRSVDEELRIASALLTPCLQACPGHPRLRRTATEVLCLIEHCTDHDLAAWAAIGILGAGHVCGEFELADRVVALVMPRVGHPRVAPATAARFFGGVGYYTYFKNDFAGALAAYEASDAIAVANGLVESAFLVGTWRGYCEWRAGRLDALDATVRALERSPFVTRAHYEALFLLLEAEWSVSRGLLQEAIRLCTLAVEKVEAAGVLYGAVTFRGVLLDWLLRLPDIENARRHLDALERNVAASASGHVYGPMLLAHRFYFHHRLVRDPVKARTCAEAALALARQCRILVCLRWAETAMPHLCAYAIEHGIHADYARQLIDAYDLRPPAGDLEHWPWPVRVRMLGPFAWTVRDRQVPPSRKAPRRLLQLLQALVAFGGTGVPARQLVDVLWPDEEGDCGAHALQVALTRLRKLIGDTEAVLVQDGCVSLDPNRCWVDALVFDRMSASADPSIEAAERACSLYGGEFLAADDAPWLVPTRERLRARYVALVERIGAHHEAESSWDRAASWYQRGIDADPLVEAFHQGVIRCYACTGRRAEAISAYRRLRQTLSVVLGIPPSAASQALYETLRAC